MIDPRILEHAVNATMRVREEIKGRRSGIANATEYGFSGEVGLGFQYLITEPLRAANFFHGPTFAEIHDQR
jgi:hypothetical protein